MTRATEGSIQRNERCEEIHGADGFERVGPFLAPIVGPTLKHQISRSARCVAVVSSAVNDADVDDDEEVVLASRSPSSFRARSRSSSFLLICVKPTFASMTKTAR